MSTKRILTNLAVFASVSSLTLGPVFAYGDHGDEGKGKGKSKGKSHWNPAPPKKNGRHDNRNWNKGRSDNRDSGSYRTDQYGDRYRVDRYGNRISDYNSNSLDQAAANRSRTKNEWQNIAIVSGALAVLGVLKKDKTLFFVGAAGTLYSLYRYEQDRKSQDQINRARAAYFGREYFVRDGVRFDRRTVVQGGEKYYQFVRR